MKFVNTKIKNLIIVEPTVFGDDRGYFFESFNLKKFEKNIYQTRFVQDNESRSSRGVLRGLHFQKPPFEQAKLVRCVEGEVIDVAVDIRKGSPTYGDHIAVHLSGKNKKQLFIPRGFAHGFSVLSESAIINYKVDNPYAPSYDHGIIYNDKNLDIDCGLNQKEIKLSTKDKDLPNFNDLNSPFLF